MQKYKIEAVGEPKTIQGQKGPFQVFGVKVNEGWVNGYYNKQTQTWKVGDEVEMIITEKAGKDGKMYKNFSVPNKDDAQNERISKLESRVMKLELAESRMIEKITAEVKSALMLELGGKFQTTADFKKQQEPHPIFKSSNPLDGIPMDEEPPF